VHFLLRVKCNVFNEGEINDIPNIPKMFLTSRNFETLATPTCFTLKIFFGRVHLPTFYYKELNCAFSRPITIEMNLTRATVTLITDPRFILQKNVRN